MIKQKSPNGIIYWRSPLLSGVTHGFSTRRGGVSVLPHTSETNLAFGRGDAEATVLENLRLFCSAIGTDAEKVVSLPQIHSAKVIKVTREMAGEGYFTPASTECDGYVTNEPGVAFGIKTADCLPILLCDKEAGVISALHAGWRGSVAGIVHNGISEMVKLGAKPEKICCALGAAIGQCCFEVGEEVRDAAIALTGSKADEFFKHGKKEGKYYFALSDFNEYLLLSLGILPKNIDKNTECTCCNSDDYFSHRKTNGNRGTILAVIAI
jgi:YfiH family protein